MGSIVSGIFGGGSSGGGGGGGGQEVPSTTTQYIREAPGIEERKLGLMDIASSLAKTPINIPAMQVAPLGALEQQGLTASGSNRRRCANDHRRYRSNIKFITRTKHKSIFKSISILCYR
jgi:hypothetical protein